MGIVDFTIDLAAVLGASRSVASKHIALRGRQLDRYGKTSSVAAALRSKQKAHGPVPSDTSSGGDRGASAASAAQQQTADTQDVESPRHERAEDVTVSKESVPNSHNSIKDIPTAAGNSRVQDTGTVHSSVLQGSEGTVTTQTSSQDPPVSTSPSKDLRLETENGEQEKLKNAQVSGATENQGNTEEVVPEGVDFEGLFRTSRGSRLSPLWKGEKNIRPVEQVVPEGVDLGVFRTGRGSNILRQLKHQGEGGQAVGGFRQQLKPEELFKATKNAENHSLPDLLNESRVGSKAANGSSERESQRETDRVEVTTGPEPARGDIKVKISSHAEKPVSENASALGEIIGAAATTPTYELRESRVPSSRLGRIWNYSGLAAGMFAGAISESFSRVTGGGGEGSLMLSPANMERLVAKLSKMRGAALKLGQMLSFQDSKMLPAPIQEVLQRVQDRADYMPAWQRDRVLATNLGAEWRDLFDDFDEKPIAAASIGQVHRATLKSNGAKVAVKIQFPGVADSINSDLDNLGVLLAATKLLPKGLYLNKTIDNARTELGWECDYEREARCAQRYRDLLAAEDDVFLVPKIYPEASGKQVLTMEFMDGVGVTRIKSFTQEQRDWIGTQILRLCLREITEFHFMQTDPNWTNFLYNAERDRLVLLDFGASREYPEHFITMYVQLLAAASRSDRETVKKLSEDLGYLTGHESKAMLDAHIASVLTLAEPFLGSAPEVYDFHDQTITERVKEQIPVMIRERLAPPPEETYSLHRKLSGAFLLCARLESKVRCRELFEKSVAKSGILENKV